jgi:hypothetical protein
MVTQNDPEPRQSLKIPLILRVNKVTADYNVANNVGMAGCIDIDEWNFSGTKGRKYLAREP